MRIYAISVLSASTAGAGSGSSSTGATLLASATDLSSFSFYQRGTVAEFLTFFARTVAERTAAGQRQSLQENSYTFHVYNRGEGVAAVMVTDQEYPVRPAFSVLTKVLEAFATKYPRPPFVPASTAVFDADLKGYLQQYQDPKHADAIMKVQAELDETKVVLHKTIEGVLARGEKLDDLVTRSDQLSAQSKRFYTTAKKQNSCCVVM